MDGPFCAISPRYPDNYDTDQQCTITIRSNGTVTATNFSTEAGYDKLSIGGVKYSGDAGPVNVLVRAGTIVNWESDYSGNDKGWRLCWSSSSPEVSLTKSLTVLSLARNYITGNTEHLESGTSLQTLLVSSNYLSCQSVQLEAATELGRGLFVDPTTDALQRVGEVLKGYTGGLANPYTSVSNATTTLENTVLVFAGNTEVPPHHQRTGNWLSLIHVRRCQQRLLFYLRSKLAACHGQM